MKGIIAVNERGIIGQSGFMPWHVPEDLQHFKSLTLGNVLVLGRITADGLRKRCIDLPGREIWVLSTSRSDGFTVEQIKQKASHCKSVFIGGGAECYQAFASLISTWHISLIKDSSRGDTQAPEFVLDIISDKDPQWRMVSRDERESVIFFQFNRVLSNSRII